MGIDTTWYTIGTGTALPHLRGGRQRGFELTPKVTLALAGTRRWVVTSTRVELPQLTLEQKWSTAESNLVYFVASGILYARSKGESAETFGTFAGDVAAPFWEEEKGKGPRALVDGISWNKQQFSDFQMEILSESETAVEARMKGFGQRAIVEGWEPQLTVDEYVRFFEKKWEAIADYLGLEYRQRAEGEWTVVTITANPGA